MLRTCGRMGRAGVLVAVPCFVSCAGDASHVDPAVQARIVAVESGLTLAAQVVGQPVPRYTVRERMEHYRVPGMGIAVVNDGEVEWSRAYGVKRVGSNEPVTEDTLFQAASITKAVSSVAGLVVVQNGLLDLDDDVNAHLTSWEVPAVPFEGEHVTLRRLLTHTAGLTLPGMEGYADGESLPTTLQILDGTPPAKTEPIRVFIRPGSRYEYSGGGFVVIQQLVEDVTGESFPTFMHRHVLAPIGMRASTYEQPLLLPRAAQVAHGHWDNGSPMEGGWHTFPELGPGGLWTTASDLARFIVEVYRAFSGAGGRVLSVDMARAMLTADEVGGWGLGLGVSEEDGRLYFSHGGSNPGYKALMFGEAVHGQGVVVVTNGDNGMNLAQEVLRAVADEYGLPGFEPRRVEEVPLATEQVQAYVGHYEVPAFGGLIIRIELSEGRLLFRAGEAPSTEIVHIGEGRFVRLSQPRSGGALTFDRDDSGAIIGFTTEVGFPAERIGSSPGR